MTDTISKPPSVSFAPPENHGMTVLDKTKFSMHGQVLALRTPKGSTCSNVTKILKGFKHILPDPEYPTGRRILLSAGFSLHSELNQLPEPIQSFAKSASADLIIHSFTLDYDYWNAEEIFRSILPQDFEIPGSFSTAGHIAHLNLKECYEPYKKLIGQVILDKSPHIRTVVNKTDNIDHTFRFFQMEILAGEDDMIVNLKEGGCEFQFDFSKVYWNSRLQAEHQRLVDQFKPGQLICDVMCGVGPFAIPAAKNARCLVFANDLNPVSHKGLVDAILMNKMAGRVKPYNIDGRDFFAKASADLNDPQVMQSLAEEYRTLQLSIQKSKSRSKKIKPPNEKPQTSSEIQIRIPAEYECRSDTYRVFDHYIMNLPASAVEFLDGFQGLFRHIPETQRMNLKMPMVHVYCFSKCKFDPLLDARKLAESHLGHTIEGPETYIYNVRKVAPNKDMLCVSFRLPKEVAFGSTSLPRKRKVDESES